MKNYSATYNLHLKLIVELLRTGDYLDSKVSAVLKDFGITHIQFNILRILEGAAPEPLPVGKIKERLLFTKSDVTRLLDRLEKKELISRNICPNNRRKMDIEITQNGLDLTEKVLPLIEETLEGFYKDKIGEEERDIVIEVLKKISGERI